MLFVAKTPQTERIASRSWPFLFEFEFWILIIFSFSFFLLQTHARHQGVLYLNGLFRWIINSSFPDRGQTHTNTCWRHGVQRHPYTKTVDCHIHIRRHTTTYHIHTSHSHVTFTRHWHFLHFHRKMSFSEVKGKDRTALKSMATNPNIKSADKVVRTVTPVTFVTYLFSFVPHLPHLWLIFDSSVTPLFSLYPYSSSLLLFF